MARRRPKKEGCERGGQNKLMVIIKANISRQQGLEKEGHTHQNNIKKNYNTQTQPSHIKLRSLFIHKNLWIASSHTLS